MLEGGYSSEGLATSCVASFLGLLGRPCPEEQRPDIGPEPTQQVEELIAQLRQLHSL